MPRRTNRPRGRPRHPDVLTPAEWRVLQLLRAGHSNPEIAERLGVSRNTVRTHVSSMLAKLDLPNREALAAWSGEPAAASRGRMRRLPLLAPLDWLRDAWSPRWAGTMVVVAVSVVGVLTIAALARG